MARRLGFNTITATVMAKIINPAPIREALFVGHDILRYFVNSSGCLDGNAGQRGMVSTKRWIRGVEIL